MFPVSEVPLYPRGRVLLARPLVRTSRLGSPRGACRVTKSQGHAPPLQGYLAQKKLPLPYDHRRVLCQALLQGHSRRLFLMSEVPQ